MEDKLKKVSNKDKYFLTKYQIFEECVFFAEIKLNSGQYLIVRRATATNTKISFKINDFKLEDFITDFESWDEENIAIDNARKLLNTYINYDILPSWTYRKVINYFMRYQNDYIDVFKLSKFQGVHKDWKPMVFDLLGFDGKLIDEKLSLEEEFEEQKALLKTLETENKVSSEDEDKVVGLIEIKQNEFDTLSDEVDKFNFYEKDNAEKEKLINDIESQIKYANTEHYNIKYEINKIEEEAAIYTDTDSVEKSTIVSSKAFGNLSIEDLYELHKNNGSAGETLAGHESVKANGDLILNWSINKKLYYAPIKRIIRHKVKKEKWKLTTYSGKEVIVTGDHSLVVFRNGEQIEIKARDINIYTDTVLVIN
jgi:hypothetical protein